MSIFSPACFSCAGPFTLFVPQWVALGKTHVLTNLLQLCFQTISCSPTLGERFIVHRCCYISWQDQFTTSRDPWCLSNAHLLQSMGQGCLPSVPDLQVASQALKPSVCLQDQRVCTSNKGMHLVIPHNRDHPGPWLLSPLQPEWMVPAALSWSLFAWLQGLFLSMLNFLLPKLISPLVIYSTDLNEVFPRLLILMTFLRRNTSQLVSPGSFS